MPKRQPQSRSIDAITRRDVLIRHHLEEASTHLGMAKALRQQAVSSSEPRNPNSWAAISKFLKFLYVRHGGDPRA